jgi:hypothetical protein
MLLGRYLSLTEKNKNMIKKILTLLVAITFIFNISFAQKYFPYSYEGKFGIVDKQGNVTLEPIFDNIDFFENGSINNYTKYSVDGNTGIIDGKGKIIVKASDKKIIYNSNGSFAWYYDDNRNSIGAHLFSLNQSKEIAFYDSLRIGDIIGEKTVFIHLNSKDRKTNILLNEKGEKILDLARWNKVKILMPEQDCPILQVTAVRYLQNYDCNGNKISNDKTEDNDSDEEIGFEDSEYSDGFSGSNERKITLQEAKDRFKKFEVVKLVEDNNGSLISIIVKKEKYGLISPDGKVLMPFDYTELATKMGVQKINDDNVFTKYIESTYQYSKRGLSTLAGEEIIPNNYGRITSLKVSEVFFKVETNDGYSFIASGNGHVYMPKGVKFKK